MHEDREAESSSTLTALPSFGQPPKIHTVFPQPAFPAEPYEDVFSDDFEFSLLIRDSETHPPITADEIFSDGHILPIYPVLANKEKPRRPQLLQLLMEEQDSSTSEVSSSYADELEGISPETYCLWPPDHSRGSVHNSAGSLFGWWIRDPVPRLSHSDGKKMSFFASEEKRSTEKKVDVEGGKNKRKGKGMDLITAHHLYYGQNGRGESRKSYLNYKPEIWRFFHRTG